MMTYNEFMKKFNEYIKTRIRLLASGYNTQAEMAGVFGISPSTVSRAVKDGTISRENLIKIFGNDIYNEDIDLTKEDLEIMQLERRLNELKNLKLKKAAYREKLFFGKE